MRVDKIKLLTTLVILLLLVNMVTIASVWMGKDGHRNMPPPPPGPKEFIIEKLGLDEEQAAAFELLRKEHFDTMETLREQIREEKEQMYDKLKNNNPDTTEAYAHLAHIIANEERAEKITFEHFRKVREICNEEQRKHFDAIISQVIKMIGMHRKPGGPGGFHGGPPPLP